MPAIRLPQAVFSRGFAKGIASLLPIVALLFLGAGCSRLGMGFLIGDYQASTNFTLRV